MKNEINIAELLKDCPTGMELDCLLCNSPIALVDVAVNESTYPIKAVCKDGFIHVLTKYGAIYNHDDAKCVIFPKGKTTWEGFVPPCKFKDGDIIANEHGNIAIYKGTMWYNKKLAKYYCGYRKSDNHFLSEPTKDGHFGLIEELHLATEEEKQKLLQAIKNNGYKWNAETKTLDKLIVPKFKVGDVIKTVFKRYKYTVIKITDTHYTLKETDEKFIYVRPISDQDNWELVPNKFDINTLVPFESRVLVRDGNTEKWKSNFWGFYDIDNAMKCPYECCGCEFAQCIPYENNEHLLGKTDDCDEFYKNWE